MVKGGHVQDVSVFADIAFGEASEGMSSRDFVGAVEGEGNSFIAELFQSLVARITVSTAIYDAANPDKFTDLEVANFFAESCNTPQYFVSRD
jgi:hypothetical protein